MILASYLEVAQGDCGPLIQPWAAEYAGKPQGREGAARRGSWQGAPVDQAGIPLHWRLLEASRLGHAGQARFHLGSGATWTEPGPCGPRNAAGYTPLMMAAEQGHLELLDVLLESGWAAAIDEAGPKFSSWRWR